MAITVDITGPERLADHAGIPIRYEVRSMFRMEEIDGGLGGLRLREGPVQTPYYIDYDAYEEGGPREWPKRFDVANWGFFTACDGSIPVGAAAVAWDTPAVNMLEGRKDLAVLWDIRVRPDRRHQGIGRALLQGAARWARSRGCECLKIETQNVNVPACRFYAQMGCFLRAIDRFAYRDPPEVRQQVMLLWYLDLRTV